MRRATIKRFCRDEEGALLVLFALLAIIIVGAAGAGIDYVRATQARQTMQSAVDATALAAAMAPLNERVQTAQREMEARTAEIAAREISVTLVNRDDGGVDVEATGLVKTSLTGMLGIETFALGVRASALPGPLKPASSTFESKKVYGLYYKKVTVWVRRPGDSADTLLGTFTYQPRYFDQSLDGHLGIGILTMDPPGGAITFGKYDRLYLRMDVRGNGCPAGQAPESPLSGFYGFVLKCVASPFSNQPTDLVLRTDDPATSHYLFVDGKQLPQGSVPPFTTVLPCGRKASQAWEDGGDFKEQDVFFDVTSTCQPDSNKPLRLVR